MDLADYENERLAEKISNIDQNELREYYECLWSGLLNHMVGYRICYNVFLAIKPEKEYEYISIFQTFSAAQKIINRIPGFGVLVQTPFQIIESELEKQPNSVIRNVSIKMGASYLKNYKYIS